MSTLKVRVYNVYQGDAVFITVPDRDHSGTETQRHVLIDVGNLSQGAGSSNRAYRRVLQDVRQALNGAPLDLYVMTHEHMDHVEGLLYAKQELGIELRADYAWLTASADPDYYDTHPDSHRTMQLAREAYGEIARYLAASGEDLPEARSLITLNNYKRTDDCVDYLRTIASDDKIHYVYRGYDLQGAHPFEEAELEILAPEEDTSEYYLGIRDMALGVLEDAGGTAPPRLNTPVPPPGVEAGSFYRLVENRRGSYVDALLSIDAAANNTSVVFSLKWRGWVLLFTGDAQTKSWWTMYDHGVLTPIHFLKVGHHGSHNATPSGAALDAILPQPPPDNRPRSAAISAYREAYGHPHQPTLDKLEPRIDDLRRTEQTPSVRYIDFRFSG